MEGYTVKKMTNWKLVCVVVLCVFKIQSVVSIHKAVGSVQEVYTGLATFTTTLQSNYDVPELEAVEDIATKLVEKVPGVGEAISFLSESIDAQVNSEILNSLRHLETSLNTLSVQLDVVKKIVSSIPKIIQISILQKQVAEDGREIENCYNNYLSFLKDPHSTVFEYRILECYGKLQYLREIGDILHGKAITFDQQSLFDEIISKSGVCNGTEITSVFKYIFGLYMKGCLSISMAESLKFTNDTSVSGECKKKTSLIFGHLKRVYLRCQNKDSCDQNEDVDRIYYIVGENNNLKSIANRLKKEFPWYFFTLLATEKEIEGNITASGKLPSMMVLKLQEKNYVTVIWFPEKSNSLVNDSDSFLYELELHQLFQPENGLDLTFSASSDFSKHYTTIYGKAHFNYKFAKNFISCRYSKIFIPRTTTVAGEEEELSTWEQFKKLPMWQQVLIGASICGGSIFFLGIVYESYAKLKKRCKEDDESK